MITFESLTYLPEKFAFVNAFIVQYTRKDHSSQLLRVCWERTRTWAFKAVKNKFWEVIEPEKKVLRKKPQNLIAFGRLFCDLGEIRPV
jgi:hypothetical protein